MSTLVNAVTKKLGGRKIGLQGLSTVIALLLIWLVLSIISPYFFTWSNFSNMLLQNANIMIMATGMTFVFICGMMDLSLGSVEALAGTVVAVLIIRYHIPTLPAILIGLVVGACCGFVNGTLIARFKFPPFVATLSMQSMARGLALITTGGTAIYGFDESFKLLGQGRVNGIPVPIIIFVVLLLVFHVILKHTRFGVNVFATGGNMEAAALSGINVKRIKIAVAMMASTFAALAGIIMTSRLNSGQGTIGEADVMDVVASVVIGGTSLSGGVGSIGGTVVGVLIISSIKNGLNILGVTAYWQQVAIGMIIIASILIDMISKGSLKKS